MLTQKPKGTKDVTPEESYIWQYIEEKARNIARTFGYREIRTPVFEHTELFLRGVGDTSDVVQKEMYTFSDKAGRSITLKPEGTAGAARSYIEEGTVSYTHLDVYKRQHHGCSQLFGIGNHPFAIPVNGILEFFKGKYRLAKCFHHRNPPDVLHRLI